MSVNGHRRLDAFAGLSVVGGGEAMLDTYLEEEAGRFKPTLTRRGSL
jgi:hypothetical protein